MNELEKQINAFNCRPVKRTIGTIAQPIKDDPEKQRKAKEWFKRPSWYQTGGKKNEDES